MSKPQCHYVKPNGALCGSPAMRGHLHCYYHHQAELRSRRRLRLGGPHSTGLDFGTLEDAASIQVAISDIMHHLVDRIIDRGTASTLLYALQLAIINRRHLQTKPYNSDVAIGDLTDPADLFDRLDQFDETNHTGAPVPGVGRPGEVPSNSTNSKPAAVDSQIANRKSVPTTTSNPDAKVSNSTRQSQNSSIVTRPMTVVTDRTPTRPLPPKKPPMKQNLPLTRPEDVTNPEIRLKMFGLPEIHASTHRTRKPSSSSTPGSSELFSS